MVNLKRERYNLMWQIKNNAMRTSTGKPGRPITPAEKEAMVARVAQLDKARQNKTADSVVGRLTTVVEQAGKTIVGEIRTDNERQTARIVQNQAEQTSRILADNAEIKEAVKGIQGKAKTDEELALKDAEDAKIKEAEDVKIQEAEDAKIKEAEGAKIKEAEAAKCKEAEDAKIKEAEAAKCKEAEAKQRMEAEAAKRKEAEDKQRQDAEAKQRMEAEAKRKEAEDKQRMEAEAKQRQVTPPRKPHAEVATPPKSRIVRLPFGEVQVVGDDGKTATVK
ncbi:rpsF, partial [Symbiodinium sp. CCMP2456]